MRRAAQVLCSLSLLVVPLACGGDDEEPEETGLTTDLRGIYTINTWTENQAGCDAEGASVLDMMSNKKLAIKLTEFFGVDLLIAAPCADPTDCAEKAEAGLFGGLFGGAALFDKGSDAAGWDGNGSSHIINNGVCEGTYFTQRMEVTGDKRVKVETKIFDTTFPAEGAGDAAECPLESAKKAAEAVPCKTLAVITATYEQPLAEPPK
jgi:hypothetical protein